MLESLTMICSFLMKASESIGIKIIMVSHCMLNLLKANASLGVMWSRLL